MIRSLVSFTPVSARRRSGPETAHYKRFVNPRCGNWVFPGKQDGVPSYNMASPEYFGRYAQRRWVGRAPLREATRCGEVQAWQRLR